MVWTWLSGGGPHFPGGWSIDTDARKGVHVAVLQTVSLPRDMRKGVAAIIRDVADKAGWRAMHVSFGRDQVKFVLKPWPVNEREAARARSEEFRLAARRRREESQKGPAGGRTPAP